MQSDAERERLDHLEALQQQMHDAESFDFDEYQRQRDRADRAVAKARDGNFGPLRQMVEDCEDSPEEREKQLTSLDRLEAARATLNRKADIRLVRMVQDVLTAKCQVCKQIKEGLLFSDRRHVKVFFKDVFLCWDDFIMIAKRTKALGLFESKIACTYFYE